MSELALTKEDVVLIREAANHLDLTHSQSAWALIDSLKDLADRIEALLPPEKEGA